MYVLVCASVNERVGVSACVNERESGCVCACVREQKIGTCARTIGDVREVDLWKERMNESSIAQDSLSDSLSRK